MRRTLNSNNNVCSFTQGDLTHLIYSVLVTALLVALFVTNPVFAAEPENHSNQAVGLVVEEPDENKLRLLGIRVRSHTLDGLLDTYAVGSIVLVPMGALASLTDLAVTVNPEKGIAQGFLYDEKRTLFLDVARNQIVLSGKVSPVNREQIKVYPSDIYIDANLLSSWLPFKLDVDLYSSTVILRSDVKLPFEERLEREKRFAKATAQRQPTDRNYPNYFEPYAQWSNPFFTATVNSSLTRNATTGQTGLAANYAIHATGDMMKMESTVYINGTDQSPVENIRLTLGRKDASARLLGPLNASEYALGHINTPSSSLISRPRTPKLGAMVSSYPVWRQAQFDRHRFQGELPAGWEVELYQNNVLIGYQKEGQQGQYVFDDVPLYFGKNYFRLVFYGPQGQKREETRSFDLNDALLPSGKQYYKASLSEGEYGDYHAGLQYDYGLGNNLSASFEYQGFTLGSEKLLGQPAESRQYGRTGLRALLGNVFVAGDIVADSSGGKMYELSAQTRIGDETTVKLLNDQLSSYVSDTFPLLADPTTSRTSVDLNTVIPPTFLPRIPVTFRLLRDGFESGASRNQLDNRIALSYSRFSISNSLTYVDDTVQPEQLTGSLQVSRRARKFSYRGEFGYSVKPLSEITNVAFTLDNIRRGKLIYSAGINRQFQVDDTQVSIGVSRPVGTFAFNASARYSTAGSHSINFGLTMGVAQEPRTPYWQFDSKPVAGMGAVSARVFIDNDLDGIFGEGDEPLPNVTFKRNGTRVPGKTDKNGIAFITNLNSHYPIDLGLDTGSLEDPLWMPALQGVRISPRPGSVARIDFPVIETGEIDGTTYFLRRGRNIQIAEVELQLINEQGKMIKTTKSAYDGFYVFDGVPYGTYLIRVAPHQVTKLGLATPQPIQVKLDRRQQFVSGMNIQLKNK
jgi:hypothetical protein